MIPDSTEFQDFLGNSKVVNDLPEESYVNLAPDNTHCTDTGNPHRTCSLFLSFPNQKLKIDSVLLKIEEALRNAKSPSNREIAIIVLGIIVECKHDSISVIEHANEVLRQFQNWEIDFSFISGVKTEQNENIYLGENLELGPFDNAYFNDWCKQGKNSFRINISKFSGKHCLTKRGIKLLLPSFSSRRTLLKRWGSVTDLFFDIYFHAVANKIKSDTASLLRNLLSVEEASSLFFFDFAKYFEQLTEDVLCLFRCTDHSLERTRVVQLQPVNWLSINQSSIDKARLWLKKNTGYANLNHQTPFLAQIQRYTKFLQEANQSSIENRNSEAFVFRIIALDLLLGDKTNHSEKISQRASIIVHKQLNKPCIEITRHLKKLYGARSNYVHQGEEPPIDKTEQLEIICREILFCLLSASSGQFFSKYEEWIKHIDFVFMSLEADKTIKADDYRKMGLAPDGKLRETSLFFLGHARWSSSEKTSHTGKCRPCGGEPEPLIGIFWYHEGKLIFYSEPASKVSSVEGIADVDTFHCYYWEKVKRQIPKFHNMEYEEIPRGRIVMKTAESKFMVYGSPQIIHDKEFRKLVIEKFNLPIRKTTFQGDSHYDDPSNINWEC